MEIIRLENDIDVKCLKAISFPDGVHDAHELLRESLPPLPGRIYFGISFPQQGDIVYRAACNLLNNEAIENDTLESFTILKGRYLAITLTDYYKDIPTVGVTFRRLLDHPELDPKGYCLEWYLSDRDVRCMVRLTD